MSLSRSAAQRPSASLPVASQASSAMLPSSSASTSSSPHRQFSATDARSGGLSKVSRVIAVNLDRERKFGEAFRYFDADSDGFIDLDALAKLLRCFGRGVTQDELDLLAKCLQPDRVTLRDFLNVLASNFASSFHMPKTQIMDAFKLHNAARSGKKSQTVMGHLEVDDGDLVSRETWRNLAESFAKPITGVTPQERQAMPSYLAKVQPSTLVRIPTDETKFAERNRVDYKQWCSSIDVKVHPKSKMQEMLHAFKLFNHTLRRKRCKHIDGELVVDDDGLILKDDLGRIMSRMGNGLKDDEHSAFMEVASSPLFSHTGADGQEYVNYVKLIKHLN